MRHAVRRLLRSRRRDQQGFTLTECLVTVVLMGVVMAPISMALTMAINATPQANNRAIAAGQRSIVIGQWSDDVESATTVALYPPGGTVACPGTTSTIVTTNLASFIWNDITAGNRGVWIIYQLQFKPVNPTIQTWSISLNRWEVAGGNTGTSTLLTGYCRGTENVLNLLQDNHNNVPATPYLFTRGVKAHLSFRDDVNEAPRNVNLEASARPTCASEEQHYTSTTFSNANC